MEKYLTIVLVVATLIFISPFSVSAGAEKEWSQKLDLSDSVSSSVIKLDDGIVVMRYEGNASENSTLTKYDFKGNQVWSIKNAYGYEMGALGDSFIVFTTGSEYTMTKISSDGKIVWSKTYEDKLYSRVTNVIELDSGFIMVASGCIYRYDNNGQRLKELYESDIVKDVFNESYSSSDNFAVTLSKDKNSLLVYITEYRSITGGTSGYYHTVAKYSLDLDYKSSVIAYSNREYEYLTKIIETDNNYIATGNNTLIFNKDGQIDKVLNLSMIDIEYIDGDIYAYVAKQTDNYGIYNTYVAKYDENLNKIMEYQLPYSFSDTATYQNNLLGDTSFAFLKNRDIFYKGSDGVHFIVLNSSFMNSSLTSSWAIPTDPDYNIAQFRLNDDDSNGTVTDDGIIDNIFENPETSSIAVVIVFVVVILLGGIGFYFGYKKKKAKNM